MRCQNWLSALQMSVGRKNDSFIDLASFQEGSLQIGKQSDHAIDRIARPKSQIGGNLVVAGPACVQFPPHISQLIDQRLLHMHVDIF